MNEEGREGGWGEWKTEGLEERQRVKKGGGEAGKMRGEAERKRRRKDEV